LIPTRFNYLLKCRVVLIGGKQFHSVQLSQAAYQGFAKMIACLASPINFAFRFADETIAFADTKGHPDDVPDQVPNRTQSASALTTELCAMTAFLCLLAAVHD
jgi:hypothetical protein